MDMSILTGVSAIAVFVQGLLSFFSPCVLPLVPLYLSYLAGGAKTIDENGVAQYKRSKVLINTLFFVIGISFAFFALGFGFSALGRFFLSNQLLFARISGILIIAFGLIQLGFLDFKWTGKTIRLPFKLDKVTMNPLVALVLGFTFSFAWTPCVGPMLTSVLLMASSAKNAAVGFTLIGLYTLGFVLPFLAVGIFTGSILNLFKKYRNVLKYTTKIGGVLMILIGVMTLTGWMNNITGYFSTFDPIEIAPVVSKAEEPETTLEKKEDERISQDTETTIEPEIAEENTEVVQEEKKSKGSGIMALDFTLKDQNGVEHSMSDYRGKVVFLNFWATWCPPCRAEMPDLQAMFEDYGYNENEVAVLGVAGPNWGREGSAEDIAAFLETNGYTYPTVMDEDGYLNYFYGISSFPTTFMIMKNGEIFGLVPGAIPRVLMENIVQQTLDASL